MGEARVRAPELPASLEWLNTEMPLRISELRGKIILLDFWSYCCINCMHVLPDLRYLENKYKENLAVIGIHSPKFPHEKVSENVMKAINRYHIRHPVAHDPEMKLWRQYGIKAWPSIIFIDAEGYVLGVLRGEGRRKQMDALIQQHLEKAEQKDILNLDPVPLRTHPEPVSTLKFPGKILATKNHLYISDSGHNRILETNYYGRVTQTFGSGAVGLLDGEGENASFNNPQGMVLVNNYLYVADTDNHAIRRIDIQRQEIVTIAGTGEQGRYEAMHYSEPLQARLNSPWDLAYQDGDLYIAMAGQHQIWKLDMTENHLTVLSGSGREDLVDGAAQDAALAQPSGICLGEYGLFFADAETSSIRFSRLPDGQVTTLVGKGLFEFGDQDGDANRALLQHPMGVVYDKKTNQVYIADTYNNKIKQLNIKSKEISYIDAGPGLNEPGGLSLVDDTIWIANTNAHEIRRLNLKSRKIEVLEINEISRSF
jgi:thiol-disulfide isomerase/thioredoxin